MVTNEVTTTFHGAFAEQLKDNVPNVHGYFDIDIDSDDEFVVAPKIAALPRQPRYSKY